MRLIDADAITEDERQEHGFFYNSDLQELLDEQPTIDISNTSNTLGALDCVSRKWLMECVDEGWIKFDTEKDKNIYVHLVRDIAPSAQPEVLACGEGELSAQPERTCVNCGRTVTVYSLL